MKILSIVDSPSWAIATLTNAIVKYNKHFNWRQMHIHPRDLEARTVDLVPVIDSIRWADIVDVQYWRTLSQLLEQVPELKTKKIILTHHNEKNLLSYDWKDVTMHIAKTQYSYDVLSEKYGNEKVTLIPNSYDHTRFKYNDKFPPEEKIVGYVGRIVPWKGLKEVARACYELGYPLMIMGKHDKIDYWNSIPKEHQENIRWDFFNCDDNEREEYYKNITCYVGFSGSGREVGTLGFIEAMASGVPVITTPAGLAGDICEDEENALIVAYDNYDQLKESIKKLMESPALQQKLRKNGWETIRNYNDERMAWEYRKMFNKLFHEKPLVSIIIPATLERIENVFSILKSLNEQTYKDIEVIIVWDHAKKENPVDLYAFNFSIRQICIEKETGYNLAEARNRAVIEADGEYIMFNDSRLLPAPDAVEKLLIVSHANKSWAFGEKGGSKRTFVENFSMIRRQDFINAGMSNERIDQYGGMSQELRERFVRQGFDFRYVPEAKAEQMLKSGMNEFKRDSIISMKNKLWKMGM